MAVFLPVTECDLRSSTLKTFLTKIFVRTFPSDPLCLMESSSSYIVNPLKWALVEPEGLGEGCAGGGGEGGLGVKEVPGVDNVLSARAEAFALGVKPGPRCLPLVWKGLRCLCPGPCPQAPSACACSA